MIDEIHRSVPEVQAIFDYFDSPLVGLTATPREEIDRNTYGLFDLVPPRAVSAPLKFRREGIRYHDLSDVDKASWDDLEWDDDGELAPEEVSAEAANKWPFNADTVDKVVAHLMTRGQKVAGGDRLGKTILFAKNQDHSDAWARYPPAARPRRSRRRQVLLLRVRLLAEPGVLQPAPQRHQRLGRPVVERPALHQRSSTACSRLGALLTDEHMFE